MSKYSGNPFLPSLSKGTSSASNKKESFNATDSAIGSVVEILAGNDENYTGVGDIIATIRNDQGRLKNETLSPMNPHMFTIPLPNEKIHCIKDGQTGQWFYTGICADKGMVNFLMNANNITYKQEEGDIPYHGNTFVPFPSSARSLDLFEGDVIMQSRYGASLRFTAANPNSEQPWQSSTNSVSPITILRNGYLPTENFDTDSAGIWLTSDQHVEIPLTAELPADLQRAKDKFGGGQIILYSDRLVLGSRTNDIILSSKATIAMCTQFWQHDVDIVLDSLLTLIEEVKKLSTEVKTQALASAQQTFPVPGVGSTLLSVQSPRFATSFQNSLSIESKLMQLKTNIEALQQK
mgnify:CR=1 FL=1